MDLPIPKDIPLPFPAPVLLLEVLVVVSFLAHILFVALMVGGSLMTFALQIAGLRRPGYDSVAHLVARTVTVNKSIAVVLGVAPLLILNTLYTPYFYAANALTGTAWILVIPLVILAFLLSYAHEYSWELLKERKGLHIFLAGSSTALFLFIPLIFLANVNLMLYPEQWGRVHGFLSTLWLPNVLPRYLHFLAAAVAVTGLFLVWWMERTGAGAGAPGCPGSVPYKRLFYSIALAATGSQLLFGPLLYLTLPPHTVSWGMTLVILIGAALAAALLWVLWLEVRSADDAIGRRFWLAVAVLSLVVLFMGTGRHMLRETAVDPHRQLVAARTDAYMARVREAQGYALIPGGLGGEALPPGAILFRRACASCHAREQRLVGPPLAEIAPLYAGNPEGIVTWAREPGRKRREYPAMPPQSLPEEDLRAIADYILESGG